MINISIFKDLKLEMQKIEKICRENNLELRYVFSFFVFDDKANPILDYTGAYGHKKTLSRVLQGLKENLEMEPGEFINV